jgi:ATP-dependent DNA helicase RecG
MPTTQVFALERCGQGLVIGIEVDLYPEPCPTAAGKSVRRTIGPHGRPQTVPFYPRDQRSRRVALGLLDFSAQVLDATSFEDLDPLAFERMRQTIVRLRGDHSLLALEPEELAKALRLVETRNGRWECGSCSGAGSLPSSSPRSCMSRTRPVRP